MADSRKKRPTFEEGLQRLEEIVEELESGTLSLDDSLARYEEGAALLKRCRELLESAEKKIEVLVKDEDGGLGTEPFDSAKADESGNDG